MSTSKPPLLRVSPLSGTVHIITRYTVKQNHLLAHTQYKVPDEEFEACIREYRRARKNRRRDR